MKTALVTGSSGFIGRNLTKKLKDLEFFIIGLDLEDISDPNIRVFCKDDIANCQLPHGIDIIYHLAGSAEPSICDKDPIKTLNTYISGTKTVLEYALKHNCKVVIPSTTGLETYQGSPGDRNYSYVISKLTTDALCYYYKQLGVDINIVRLSNVYGQNYSENDTRVIPTLIKKIKNGERVSVADDTRSFISIDMVIDYLINIEEDVKITASPISIKDLVLQIENSVTDKNFNMDWINSNEDFIITKHRK